MPKIIEHMEAAITSSFCIGESFMKVETTRRWTRSIERKTWALREDFAVWEYGFVVRLEEALRDHGGLSFCCSGEGEAMGLMGNARAFAVEL